MALEESLLQAIKKDDLKEFNSLTEKVRCGSYRLGRFPVLSLLYLYKSRKLLSVYEEKFLKITDFEAIGEPLEISRKFSAKAGKCLRLYFNEIVSPLEMLLILDKIKRLKQVYRYTKPSSAVKGRLKSIYSIKYSLSVKFEGDDIIIDRRPLSYREKKNIATVCLCSVLGVALAVGVPVTTVALIPEPVEGEVRKLSQINFASYEEYTLTRDIVLPENYSVEKVNCNINGGGKKLVFGKGASLGEFNGKISDLVIESSGDALFTSVSEKASIENVTVNVNADITAEQSSALIAVTNYGTIDGVTVNVGGKLNAVIPSDEDVTELIFGGIVQNNSYIYDSSAQTVHRGTISNCAVNYSGFALAGEVEANSSFGGIAGINGGYVQDCTVTGEIKADTFDIAGICALNNGMVTGSVNEANLSQTSGGTGWNPIVCGIVLTNAYAIENCENRGTVSAVSNCGEFEIPEDGEPTVAAAGIAYLNRSSGTTPYIKNCVNSGNVECSAVYRNIYAAGLCISSSGDIEQCKNSGAVTIKAENGFGVNAGGITALSYGTVYNAVNEGDITAAGSGTANIGGISAHSCGQFLYCLSKGDISVTAQDVCAGGIIGFSEVTRYAFYVYCGTVDYCISESKINVTVTDGAAACVGGIAGLMREAGYGSGEAVQYFGGRVTNCYFTGAYVTPVEYFGNIIGVSGANVYEKNTYTSGTAEYHNYEDNYYTENNFTAFGATLNEEGTFETVADKGATLAAITEIQASEIYNFILSKISEWEQ